MVRKRIISLILILLFYQIGMTQIVIPGEKYSLHPRNQLLQKLNLINPPRTEWLYPEIPRVTAAEAFTYYRSGKAFFIWIGVSGGMVPGGIHFNEGQAAGIDPNRLTIGPDKIVILYCY